MTNQASTNTACFIKYKYLSRNIARFKPDYWIYNCDYLAEIMSVSGMFPEVIDVTQTGFLDLHGGFSEIIDAAQPGHRRIQCI